MRNFKILGPILLASILSNACGSSQSDKVQKPIQTPNEDPDDDSKGDHGNTKPVDPAPIFNYQGAITLNQLAPYTKIYSQDLGLVENSDLKVDEEYLEFFDLSENSESQFLIDWLEDRLAVIIGPKPKNMRLDVVIPQYSMYSTLDLSTLFKDDTEGVLATNGGAAVFQAVQKNFETEAYGVLRSDGEKFPIASPRQGFIQIGLTTFKSDYQIDSSNTASLSNSLQRLQTLFHEARHSDGNSNSETIGLSHVACPYGHDYAFQYACDDFNNGPYRIGNSVLKMLKRKYSDKLSSDELAMIDMLLIDSHSRILDESQTVDSSPEDPLEVVDYSDFYFVKPE